MKIAHLIKRYLSKPSGSVMRCVQISNHQSKSHQVEVYSRNSGSDLSSEIHHHKISYGFIPSSWPNRFSLSRSSFLNNINNKVIRNFQSYRQIVNGEYDILHCHQIFSAPIVHVYRDKITKPLLLDIHGLVNPNTIDD